MKKDLINIDMSSKEVANIIVDSLIQRSITKEEALELQDWYIEQKLIKNGIKMIK